MYLVYRDELEQLSRGEVRVKDLITPEKEALITWSGDDIKLMLEKHQLKIDLSPAVGIVRKSLEHCECAQCVQCAFDCLKDHLKEQLS